MKTSLKITRRRNWRTRPPSICYEVRQTDPSRTPLGSIHRYAGRWAFGSYGHIWLNAAMLREITVKIESLEAA